MKNTLTPTYLTFFNRSYRYDRRSDSVGSGVKHKPTNLFGSTLAIGGRPGSASLGRPRSLDRASELQRQRAAAAAAAASNRPLSAAASNSSRPFSAAAQQFGTAALRSVESLMSIRGPGGGGSRSLAPSAPKTLSLHEELTSLSEELAGELNQSEQAFYL